MRIDPRLLIDFAIIAEERSFTRAAARLRVAQPWLSVRLHRLEELIGFPLLVRTTRHVALTDRGAKFLEAAQAVARASEEANALAMVLQRSTVQRLRIGAAPYTKVMRERRRLIDRFRAIDPVTSLELETGWSVTLLDRLQAGHIDLTFMMGAFDPTLFRGAHLSDVGLALTLAHDHPLAALPRVEPQMLGGYPVQVFTRSLNPCLWDDLYAPLIAAGVRFVEVPDMAEGAPGTMDDNRAIAAFFDFGEDDDPAPGTVRRPLSGTHRLAFSLLRRPAALSGPGEAFWKLASKPRHGS